MQTHLMYRIQTSTYGWYKEDKNSKTYSLVECIEHSIEFDKTKTIAKIPNYYSWVIRESLELWKNPFTVNSDTRLEISYTCGGECEPYHCLG